MTELMRDVVRLTTTRMRVVKATRRRGRPTARERLGRERFPRRKYVSLVGAHHHQESLARGILLNFDAGGGGCSPRMVPEETLRTVSLLSTRENRK